VGTTATTSVDPVAEIADLAEAHNMWLHVDAAYAGPAAMLWEMEWMRAGWDRADSILINPHKWLFTPVDLSALYCRRMDAIRAAFSLVPPYLQTAEDGLVRDYMNYGPQLGRRFRALKLWFILRAFGRDGVERRLRHHVGLAKAFRGWVEEDPGWEIIAPSPFSVVCFRAHPTGVEGRELDALNIAIGRAVSESGEAFVAHTILDGKVILRLAIGNLHTEERHVQSAWRLLQEALEALSGARLAAR
jgi:aromatic-L-amino-acid decarboxylase